MVDGTLSICPKGASVTASGPGLLRLGEEEQRGVALSCGSCRGLARVRPSGTHPGFPRVWAHRVVGGTGWGKRRNGLCPSLSAELVTLVSKNNKTRS